MYVKFTKAINNNLMVFSSNAGDREQFIYDLMKLNGDTMFYEIDGDPEDRETNLAGLPTMRTEADIHNLLFYLHHVLDGRFVRMFTEHHIAGRGHDSVTTEHPIILFIDNIDVLSEHLDQEDMGLLDWLASTNRKTGLTIVSTSTSSKPDLPQELFVNLACSVIDLDRNISRIYEESFLDD